MWKLELINRESLEAFEWLKNMIQIFVLNKTRTSFLDIFSLRCFKLKLKVYQYCLLYSTGILEKPCSSDR
jgi:hypothetical protein